MAERWAVVGGGLGGSLMAIYLARRGFEVDVYEMRADPRTQGDLGGRSINLALSNRGLDALSRAGIADRVLDMAVPMRGRMMHAASGRLTFQPYGTDASHVINSVSRAGLNMALLEAAESLDGVRVAFGKKCTDVDLERGAVALADAAGGEAEMITADRVVGADGAYSAVRRQLLRLDRFDYHQAYLDHGYKELVIPPTADGRFAMEPNALHIWPRGGYMMIALPNADRSFTCTVFWPFEGPNSFAAIRDAADLNRFFERSFPDALPLMPALVDDYFRNSTASLVTVRCRPWHSGDRVVLLGDACHAVVPFYGQGANASFEDCIVLDQAIGKHEPDRARAFAAYEAARRPHVDVLADLAIENFVEMRDRVASRAFLARKQLEKTLQRAFPRWFVPLYSMVTFSRIPYGDAVARDRRQWLVVKLAAFAAVTIVIAALAMLLA